MSGAKKTEFTEGWDVLAGLPADVRRLKASATTVIPVLRTALSLLTVGSAIEGEKFRYGVDAGRFYIQNRQYGRNYVYLNGDSPAAWWAVLAQDLPMIVKTLSEKPEIKAVHATARRLSAISQELS